MASVIVVWPTLGPLVMALDVSANRTEEVARWRPVSAFVHR